MGHAASRIWRISCGKSCGQILEKQSLTLRCEGLFVQKGVLSSLLRLLFLFCCHTLDLIDKRSEIYQILGPVKCRSAAPRRRRGFNRVKWNIFAMLIISLNLYRPALAQLWREDAFTLSLLHRWCAKKYFSRKKVDNFHSVRNLSKIVSAKDFFL